MNKVNVVERRRPTAASSQQNSSIVDQASAKIANYIILMTKYYIYLCRCNDSKLNVNTALNFIQSKYKIRIRAGFPKLPKIEILCSNPF